MIMKNFKFYPKRMVATCGVNAKLQKDINFAREMEACVLKHLRNEGEECKSDNKLNEQAIKNMDGRVVSTFNCAGTKIYIITDGLHLKDSAYKEYPLTTILFPEEY